MAHGELGAAKATCCVGEIDPVYLQFSPRPLIYCVNVMLLEWWCMGKEDEALKGPDLYLCKPFPQKSIHLLTWMNVYSLYQIKNNQNTNEDLF